MESQVGLESHLVMSLVSQRSGPTGQPPVSEALCPGAAGIHTPRSYHASVVLACPAQATSSSPPCRRQHGTQRGQQSGGQVGLPRTLLRGLLCVRSQPIASLTFFLVKWL